MKLIDLTNVTGKFYRRNSWVPSMRKVSYTGKQWREFHRDGTIRRILSQRMIEYKDWVLCNA